ncbi:MAG: excinuclease ABC subunit UvrB [Candidatus Heimdallarchaeota archaeon]|nr:excinuclease ABC subunit UvrB [Candidatus Heimdallarchaeota archaeon]
MNKFKLAEGLTPKGDQPKAIETIVEGLNKGLHLQVLQGVTGSGKTFSVANIIEQVQLPTLVLSPNKTLAAQLCSDFRRYFPDNAVEYFVSYYDYYQPEAYVPRTDTYIAKDSSINEEIEKMRFSTTHSLATRSDVVVVASVSAIFGLSAPESYRINIPLKQGMTIKRRELLRRLVALQYERNDFELKRGTFRAKGDTIEIFPPHSDKTTIRIEMYGDLVEKITENEYPTGNKIQDINSHLIFPATHYLTEEESISIVCDKIEKDLEVRLKYFQEENLLLEAQRLEERTRYDLEMLRTVGYCSGIENYSLYLDNRNIGERPFVLLDHFPDEFLMVIDESHITIPQIHGMYGGDRSRKETLVNYGFRLPSALENRPLKFAEFEPFMKKVIFTSATPGPYELKKNELIVEQIIRPTGLVDPEIILKPIENQIDVILDEIKYRTDVGERTLVTTLTKRMAEELSEYLIEKGIKAHYLHSEVDTIDRITILRDLRKGKYDALVGINLLREGLDLPEVSLVTILDADKEGFLRSERSLTQIIGRASRNINGKVILFADRITDSIRRTIDENNRRRRIQIQYNKKHNITPQTIQKSMEDITDGLLKIEAIPNKKVKELKTMEESDLVLVLMELKEQMREAAQKLEFEKAAEIRDIIREIEGNIS